MAFPVAAAIAYGMIAGGGIAGGAAAIQRLWRYFASSPEEQDAEDAKMTGVLGAAANALAQARFHTTIEAVPPRERAEIQNQTKSLTPLARRQINEAAKAKFGKTISRLSKAQQESLLQELAGEYDGSV
jgi:hypothetical protein